MCTAPKGDLEFAGESKSVSYESGAGEANEVRARFTDTTAIVSDPAGVEPGRAAVAIQSEWTR
jgi:hypothetical protein